MDSAKPSVELVRSLTDEHVLRALIRHRRLTRAELATEIGISKPTAGESVRRLAERGLLVDTGERTQGGRGRGRVGSYYSLAADVGTALAVSIAPEGVVAELVDVYGETLARATHQVSRPALPAQVAAALAATLTEIGGGRARLAVVSAADPVDRATGRLVQLPDAPFLVGELDPVEILGPRVAGPVIVDNDVNWAARAEGGPAPDDFAYLFLGEGLGCAVVSDGEVKRGRNGLAGEISHLLTVGTGGRATPFIEVFRELGLRRAESSAIDVDRLLAAAELHETLGQAVAGVIAAVVALADPGTVVLGGSWGPALVEHVRAAVGGLPRQVPVRAAELTGEPALTGARADAVRRLQETVMSTPA